MMDTISRLISLKIISFIFIVVLVQLILCIQNASFEEVSYNSDEVDNEKESLKVR